MMEVFESKTSWSPDAPATEVESKKRMCLKALGDILLPYLLGKNALTNIAGSAETIDLDSDRDVVVYTVTARVFIMPESLK